MKGPIINCYCFFFDSGAITYGERIKWKFAQYKMLTSFTGSFYAILLIQNILICNCIKKPSIEG